jgi:hypothetical protein
LIAVRAFYKQGRKQAVPGPMAKCSARAVRGANETESNQIMLCEIVRNFASEPAQALLHMQPALCTSHASAGLAKAGELVRPHRILHPTPFPAMPLRGCRFGVHLTPV